MLEKGIYFSGDGTNVAVLIEKMFVCTIFGSICCVNQFYFDLNCLKSFSFQKKVSCPCKRGYYLSISYKMDRQDFRKLLFTEVQIFIQ